MTSKTTSCWVYNFLRGFRYPTTCLPILWVASPIRVCLLCVSVVLYTPPSKHSAHFLFTSASSMRVETVSSVFSTELTPPLPGLGALYMLKTHLRNGQTKEQMKKCLYERGSCASGTSGEPFLVRNAVSVSWVRTQIVSLHRILLLP